MRVIFDAVTSFDVSPLSCVEARISARARDEPHLFNRYRISSFAWYNWNWEAPRASPRTHVGLAN